MHEYTPLTLKIFCLALAIGRRRLSIISQGLITIDRIRRGPLFSAELGRKGATVGMPGKYMVHNWTFRTGLAAAMTARAIRIIQRLRPDQMRGLRPVAQLKNS